MVVKVVPPYRPAVSHAKNNSNNNNSNSDGGGGVRSRKILNHSDLQTPNSSNDMNFHYTFDPDQGRDSAQSQKQNGPLTPSSSSSVAQSQAQNSQPRNTSSVDAVVSMVASTSSPAAAAGSSGNNNNSQPIPLITGQSPLEQSGQGQSQATVTPKAGQKRRNSSIGDPEKKRARKEKQQAAGARRNTQTAREMQQSVADVVSEVHSDQQKRERSANSGNRK